jgi:Family of unknown function (DUF5691)
MEEHMPVDPVTEADLATVRQALTLGLARQPFRLSPALQALSAQASDGRDPVLAILALIGQRLRFERPPTHEVSPVPEAATRLHQDERPILPEPLRRSMLRLINGADKHATGMVASAAVLRLRAVGLRLNPFDLPALMPHLKAQIGQLGLAERAYLALTETSEASAKPSSLLFTDITRENWAEFTKGHRASFLRTERRTDAAAARALLEGVFKTEPAAVRSELLEALDVGLSAADLPFLESIAADRAESVRTIAGSLITRIPGTAAFEARVTVAAACFARASGLGKVASAIGLGNEVVFKVPKDTNAEQLRALFAGLTADQIATAAGISIIQLLDALPTKDVTLFFGLLEAARPMPASSPGGTMELVTFMLSPERAEPYPNSHFLHLLAAELTEPLADEFAGRLLQSSRWNTVTQRLQEAAQTSATKDDGTLLLTAMMLPVSAMPAFLQSISPLLVTTTRTARDFAEFTLSLDGPVKPLPPRHNRTTIVGSTDVQSQGQT